MPRDREESSKIRTLMNIQKGNSAGQLKSLGSDFWEVEKRECISGVNIVTVQERKG